jgi:DNA-binding beta-propeller fold protein YncE
VQAILPTLRLERLRARRDNPAKLTHQIVRYREATLMKIHRWTFALGAGAALTIIGLAWAQISAPTNSLPNPYKSIENWAKMPEGRVWGSTSGVDVDRDGKSIWVAERCGVFAAPSQMKPGMQFACDGSPLDPILKFDASGKLVTHFGAGMFVFPHGLHVDPDGNVWVTDNIGKDGKGHQVFKFSPEGKLLMTLGQAGVAGSGLDQFNAPSAVLVAPNGNVFVADGHGGNTNARIMKFTRDGKLIKTWGHKGAAPGEIDIPHALAMDSQGRLFVADRGNNRIQIFDQEGNSLALWPQFSRPSGIYIDRNDVIYVADSESESVAKNHDGWKRGIRIGSARDGSVTAFIPDPAEKATTTSAAEGVTADSAGNIYGAEVGPKRLMRYVKN